MSNNVVGGSITVVDFEEHATVLEQSELLSKMLVGSALIYRVRHPKQGVLILVSTTSGDAAHITV